jgi:hypothetical protein
MKLQSVLLASVAALSLFACAAPTEDAGSTDEDVNLAKPLAAGKYVSNGRILALYGRCSDDNFLDSTAQGSLGADGHTISVLEGDVCGSYALTSPKFGVVHVTWKKPAGSHLDAQTVASCRSAEGDFEMTEASRYSDLTAGTYTHGSAKLVVETGCNGKSSLKGAHGTVIPKTVSGVQKPFFQLPEGDLCGGYVITKNAAGALDVKWDRPAGAHLDSGTVAACHAAEGTYR